VAVTLAARRWITLNDELTPVRGIGFRCCNELRSGVVTRKYPLDPLRRVREEAVDQKVRALSESLRHVEATRDQAERTERRKRELESALEATAGAQIKYP